jgi:hypothetical protein
MVNQRCRQGHGCERTHFRSNSVPTNPLRTASYSKTSNPLIVRAALAVCATALSIAGATDAHATRADLTAFLDRAQSMGTHNRAVRADLTITKADGKSSKAVAIIGDDGKKIFYATNDGAWRALAPLDWNGKGKVSASKDAKLAALGPDDRLGDTDLRPISFFPAWGTSDRETSFISDNTRLEKTVTIYAPDEIPYLLFVITFDKEKLIPKTVKYYAGEMNNLVRVQIESDHTMVGARPRPRKILISNYENNTKTTFDIEWKLLDSAPEALMSEATFASAPLEP